MVVLVVIVSSGYRVNMFWGGGDCDFFWFVLGLNLYCSSSSVLFFKL